MFTIRLSEFLHRFLRHALAVSGFGKALYFAQAGVAGDRSDLVCRTAYFRQPPCRGLSQPMRRPSFKLSLSHDTMIAPEVSWGRNQREALRLA